MGYMTLRISLIMEYEIREVGEGVRSKLKMRLLGGDRSCGEMYEEVGSG
jgi:hypothetical protein